MVVMLRLARKNLSWVEIEQYPWFLDACLMKEGWRTRQTLSRIDIDHSNKTGLD